MDINKYIYELELNDNSYKSYTKLAHYLNNFNINTKILNVNYLFDLEDYYFMIAKTIDNLFYLIDLNRKEKSFILSSYSLNMYLQCLNIDKQNLCDEKVYYKRKNI